MHNLEKTIKNFGAFLNQSWSSIDCVLENVDWDNDAYWLEDWLETSWKELVERVELGKGRSFQPYGFYNPKDALKGDLTLLCSDQKEDSGDNLLFRKLVSLNQGMPELKPPFNTVVAFDKSTNSDIFIALEDVSFFIGEPQKEKYSSIL